MSITTALCEAQAPKDPVDLLVGSDFYMRGWIEAITNTVAGTFVEVKLRVPYGSIIYCVPLASVRGLHVDKVAV